MSDHCGQNCDVCGFQGHGARRFIGKPHDGKNKQTNEPCTGTWREVKPAAATPAASGRADWVLAPGEVLERCGLPNNPSISGKCRADCPTDRSSYCGRTRGHAGMHASSGGDRANCPPWSDAEPPVAGQSDLAGQSRNPSFQQALQANAAAAQQFTSNQMVNHVAQSQWQHPRTLDQLNDGAAVGEAKATDWRARCLAAEERGNRWEGRFGEMRELRDEAVRRVGELELAERRRGGK